MIYQNNFRYGEISRRNAGRFDMEAYSQGAFQFINAQTMVAGGFKRRPPLKKLIDLEDEIFCIRRLRLSESLSYCIAFADTKVYLYRFVLKQFTLTGEASYPEGYVMTSDVANSMSYSQYYDRMYFASRSFHPFFIQVDPISNTFIIKKLPFITNKDGKKLIAVVPSREKLEESGASENVIALGGKIVYAKFVDSAIKYYFYDENDEMYNQEYTEAANFPPEQINADTSIGFESYPDDDDLCVDNDPNTYPAIVSIINDSMYLANTARRPHTIWKSRILGSSQWITDNSSDSMHDFIRFQFVYTESKDIVDIADMPQAPIKDVYYQTSGNDAWYKPAKKPDGGFYSEVEWQYQDYNVELLRHQVVDPETDEVISTTYTEKGSGLEYNPDVNGSPVRRPVLEYDFSDPDKIIKKTTDISLISTDSCAMKFDLNTGSQDSIVSITSACGRIIVCTTTSEHTLPAHFSAVSNSSAEVYGYHGSLSIRPVVLNDSFIFIQRGNVAREFFLYEGYMNRADLCAINREILDADIVDMTVKNTPEPCVYITLSNGEMRVLTYDKELGIQSWSRWTFSGLEIISTAVLDRAADSILIALVSEGKKQMICQFDENANKYTDIETHSYSTKVETPYAEIIDQNLVFGRYKRAKSAWIRPYETGRVSMGNDERQMNLSNSALGSEDYRFALMGSSKRQFSMKLESYNNEPMNILALAWEAD